MDWTGRFQTKSQWLCLFTDSPVGLGSWQRKRGTARVLPGLSKTKVLCHSYKSSLVAGFSFSLGICTMWGTGFSMWEPLFLYRGELGFSGSGWCLSWFSFLNYASGCCRHHLLGWQRAAPQLLGSRVGKTSKGEEAQFLSMAQRAGIYMYWWEVTGLLLPGQTW